MHDLCIHDATVVDGTGRARYRGDVAVTGGRIDAITPPGGLRGAACRARRHASGLVLAPGFIDSHTHSDVALLAEPTAVAKVSQGVTTEVLGNCGWSIAPLSDRSRATYRHYGGPIFGHETQDWGWSDFAGYFAQLDRQGAAVNALSLVGHGALRAAVVGFEDRPLRSGEVGRMQELLDEAMRQGAAGLSTGLAYAPGCYADTEELVMLAGVAAAHGGLYATHLRDQVDGLEPSVEEALQIGRRAGLPVVISHHKTVGRRNFGKVERTLARLDEVHAEGPSTYSDMYPYLEGSSTMLALLPPWALADDGRPLPERLRDERVRARILAHLRDGLPGWENRSEAVGWHNVRILQVDSRANAGLVGLTLSEAAARRKTTPETLLLDLLAEEDGRVGSLITNSCEEDLVRVFRHPRTMIGSDGLHTGEKTHPRLYGTFPRVLGRYVRERGELELEDAVHRMTGLTARVFGLEGRGVIREGAVADLTLFDPAAVEDHATHQEPTRLSRGIVEVFVGGVPVYQDGAPTGHLPGRVLPHRRSDSQLPATGA